MAMPGELQIMAPLYMSRVNLSVSFSAQMRLVWRYRLSSITVTEFRPQIKLKTITLTLTLTETQTAKCKSNPNPNTDIKALYTQQLQCPRLQLNRNRNRNCNPYPYTYPNPNQGFQRGWRAHQCLCGGYNPRLDPAITPSLTLALSFRQNQFL